MHKIALIDMDGSVADYDGAMRRELLKLRSPTEPELVLAHDQEEPWLEARKRLIAMQPGFWRSLAPLPVGFEIVRAYEEAGFTLHVLTKGPSRKPNAWSEKVEWCREFLPQAQVTITEDKSLTYGASLTDDWPPYFMGWLAHRPRGVVIVPAQPWNVDAERHNPRRIFRYDGSNPHALKALCLAIAARKEGESLDVREVVGSLR